MKSVVALSVAALAGHVLAYNPQPTGFPVAPRWHGNDTGSGWFGAFKPVARAALNDEDAKSAGDYYNAATSTGAAASYPTDTSDVSAASANDLPPVATGSMSKLGLENGAATTVSAASMLGSFAAALTAYFL